MLKAGNPCPVPHVATCLAQAERSGQSHELALLKTAEDRPQDDTSIREVHAEGHLRRRLSTLKMLLSGHLHRGKLILTDRRTAPAKFFPFWGREDFVGLRKILPGTPGLTTSRDSRPWLSSRAKLGSLLRGTSFTKNGTLSEGYAPLSSVGCQLSRSSSSLPLLRQS